MESGRARRDARASPRRVEHRVVAQMERRGRGGQRARFFDIPRAARHRRRPGAPAGQAAFARASREQPGASRAHRREHAEVRRGVGGEGARAAGARRARQGAPATTARRGHRGSVRPPGGHVRAPPQLPADIPHREVQPAVPVLHARGGHRPDGEGRAAEHRRGGARREALRGQRRGQDQAHRRRTHRPPRPRGNHPQTPRVTRA